MTRRQTVSPDENQPVRHTVLFWGIIFFLVTLVLFFFQATGLGQMAELQALDLFRRGHPPQPDIVILAIDQHSLVSLGRWPWSRELEAQIIDKLASAEPTLVALDLILAQPSDKPAQSDDHNLTTAIKNFSRPVILASEGVFYQGSSVPQQVILPLSALTAQPNVIVGHVNVTLDHDGRARALPQPFIVAGGTNLPFSVAIARQLNVPPANLTRHLIAFAGPAGTYPTYSIAELVANKIPIDALRGKIVLIGATASDLHDTIAVPVNPGVMAGIEWQANVLDNLLSSRSIPMLPAALPIGIGLLLGLGFLWATQRWQPKMTMAGLILTSLILPLASFIAWRTGWALPYLGNLTLVASLFVIYGLHRWRVVEAEKRHLKQTVQPYFSPQVLDAILKDPTKLKLGGERREVTIFFSDIRSFTTLSESLSPERLTHFLKTYFTAMSGEIQATDGVLAQFLGDGIYAFWGAPMKQLDHANRAMITALAMLRRLEQLNQVWSREGYPKIRIGIGINTGFAVVGNTGSQDRFDYAAIGDTTNTAARLEALNKDYQTQIIISELTKNQLTIPIRTRSLGSVTVRGKTKAITIYEAIPEVVVDKPAKN